MIDDTPKTIEIPLTKGYIAIIDECDADLKLFKWHACHSTKDLYYAGRNVIKPSGKRGILFLHSAIFERVIGRPLVKGEYPDHIDLNSMNNTRSNLRLVNNSINQHNRHIQRNNTSGYKGVSFHKQLRKWTARISVNGKTLNIGVYDTPEAAYKAYCDAAIHHYGEFARLE